MAHHFLPGGSSASISAPAWRGSDIGKNAPSLPLPLPHRAQALFAAA
jgi:hypothetical protein